MNSENMLYKTVTARKSHKCSLCMVEIAAKETYWKSSLFHWLSFVNDNKEMLEDEWEDMQSIGPTDWFVFEKLCQSCALAYPVILNTNAEASDCEEPVCKRWINRDTGRLKFGHAIPHPKWGDRWTIWQSLKRVDDSGQLIVGECPGMVAGTAIDSLRETP